MLTIREHIKVIIVQSINGTTFAYAIYSSVFSTNAYLFTP